MKVEIRLVNEQGRALPTRVRKEREKYLGFLRARQERVDALGRFVTKAQLLHTDGTFNQVLPELVDAHLLWVEDGAIRISGTEQVKDVQFTQTWEGKVLK